MNTLISQCRDIFFARTGVGKLSANSNRRLIAFLAALLIAGLVQMPQAVEAQTRHLPADCELEPDDIVFGPPDPGAPGPYDVARTEYDFGNDAAELPDFPYPVELIAEVTYPEQLGCGPFPIIFIMHGGHATCITRNEDGPGQLDAGWPCDPVPENEQDTFCGGLPADLCDPDDPAFPSYKGYRYLTERLASMGFVTVSMSGNGIAQAAVADHDAWAHLFQRHFGLWTAFSTASTAPFGNLFVGRIDLGQVGIIGHSRGGAGAARLLDVMGEVDDPFGTLGSKGGGFRIRGALLIGPAAADDDRQLTVADTALGVVLPYCDGDQDTLPGVGYFDKSRYAQPGDTGNKHSFEVIGATHTGFNSLWDPDASVFETVDDWIDQYGSDGPFCQPHALEADSKRLTAAEHQGSMDAIAGAFFRTYLRHETAYRGFLTGEGPVPPSAVTDGIFVGYHPKDEPESRLDLNRLEVESEALTNTLGGAVSHDQLTRYEYCDPMSNPAPDFGCITDIGVFFDNGQVPHYLDNNGFPVSHLRIAWDNPAGDTPPYFRNVLPGAFRDVSGYEALQFRAFVDMADSLNPEGQPQDLRVVLHDGAGLSSSVVVSDYSSALFYPPSVLSHAVSTTAVPRAIFNTVRVPLSAFNGIFLADIESVELVFDQTASGALNIADMLFADEVDNKLPVISCSLAEPQLMAGGDKLIDVGLSVMASDDQGAGLPTLVTVYSDEDDTDSQNNQSSPDAKDIADGTLRLRAERDGAEDGRVYLILAGATDNDGASGYGCCTATVPAGNQQADIDSVLSQADTALAQCTGFAAASVGLTDIPEGYFQVGDGPIIGPNQ